MSKRAPYAGTLYLVHMLSHATRARLDAALVEFGLSSFQYAVMSVIARNEGQSSSRLSRRFLVTPRAMTETVAELEHKGAIARTPPPASGKAPPLSLTPMGQEIWAAASGVVEQFEHTVFAGRSEAELNALRELLTAVLADLREPAPT